MTTSTVATVPLPARVTPSADGGYTIKSSTPGMTSTDIDIVGGEWMVWPGQVGDHIDVTDARAYISELRDAVDAADKLNKARPRPLTPCDAAITIEVEALIGDTGWTTKEAASAFDMTQTKLTSRLRGYTAWTVGDIFSIAAAVGSDYEESREIMLRLVEVGDRAQDESAR